MEIRTNTTYVEGPLTTVVSPHTQYRSQTEVDICVHVNTKSDSILGEKPLRGGGRRIGDDRV